MRLKSVSGTYTDIFTSGTVIVENGVKLRLNIVDTPGYGDQINNENWYVTALAFLLVRDSMITL